MRQRSAKNPPNHFMDYVQLHERAWGTKMYSGRPKLADVLAAPVVVFWKSNANDDRWTITLHDDLRAVEMHFLKMLFRSSINPPDKRVFRIYHNQKRVIIKHVRVFFAEADE